MHDPSVSHNRFHVDCFRGGFQPFLTPESLEPLVIDEAALTTQECGDRRYYSTCPGT